MTSNASIAACLEGKTILLTGATGLVGRMVLHQLLRHCPSVAQVICVVRGDARKGIGAAQRFDHEVLGSSLLSELFARPDAAPPRSRVELFDGDLALERLGSDVPRWEALARRVDLIINCAGLVEFTGPLDAELAANVDGPLHLLALAEAEARGDAGPATLCHMSTCFVSGERDGAISEDAPRFDAGSGAEALVAADVLSELRKAVGQVKSRVASRAVEGAEARRELKRLMVAEGRRQAARLGWPNVYTLSKALGERALAAARTRAPVVIVRPSIVGASLNEAKGWLDGRDSVTPIAALMWSGHRPFPIRRGHLLDVIPVDLVANATIAIAARASVSQAAGVYHLCSGAASCEATKLFDLTWRGLKRATLQRPHARLAGQPIAVPDWLYQRALSPGLGLATAGGSAAISTLEKVLAGHDSQRSPAWVSASRALLHRGRPLLKSLHAVHIVLDAYAPFFARHQPRFALERTDELYRSLTDKDRACLPFDPKAIDWADYWMSCQMPGVLEFGFARLGLTANETHARHAAAAELS